ncbi:serine/threonine-protein kinase [Chamaesiphon sp. VAR_48_metabat_403]|uniref:serine/threonine-protein kinase n=1 Tax=Chamaesiphon sp. VAR_48_metabat_403 TaxID=2964700 RepID=UPI00286E8753|nr:serine/threonine-protein kinase [Chamaesiphon sp. VAR_48_metabat_403]
MMIDAVISKSAMLANFDRDKLQWQSNKDESTIDSEILAGRYLRRSILHKSNFGMTWLAQNVYLPGQPACVIKQLATRFTDPKLTQIAIAQTKLEALSLSRLGSHAQIPSLIDYVQSEDDLYLVEEYIPGSVLTEIIENQDKFTEVEVEEFLIKMLRLLEYIHAHDLIHCDIKPQNIIRSQTDRRFVLIDFGAVKDIDPVNIERKRDRTSSVSIGTPGFAPPEQLANRAVPASDLYALGMTCIYLLTGKDPSQFPTDPYTCELMWWDSLDLRLDLRETISKTIQIPLGDRYQSATQVLTDLDNRSIRAKLRTYLDQKHAVSKTQQIGNRGYYPAVVHWALGIE